MEIIIKGDRREGKTLLAKTLYQFLQSTRHDVDVPVESNNAPVHRMLTKYFQDGERVKLEELEPRKIKIIVDNPEIPS